MDFILTTVLVNEKSRASKCSVPRSSSKLKSWLVRDQWFSGRWLLIISLVRGIEITCQLSTSQLKSLKQEARCMPMNICSDATLVTCSRKSELSAKRNASIYAQ